MSEIGEETGSGPSTPNECDGNHAWAIASSETPEQTKNKNNARAAKLRTKPSKADQAKGPEFENKAIDANMKRLDIQATSVLFKCVKAGCTAQQEVDILGRSQIAEAKSRSAKGVKNSGDQARNYRAIQKQLFGSSAKPLAKIDGNHPDVSEARDIYKRREFATEVVA